MKEENKELIIIKQLPIIEENLKKLSAEIDKDVKEALALEVTEETVKGVKKTRTSLKQDFEELESQRKFVKEKVLAPYMAFEDVYKTYVSDKYKEADITLKTKIDDVENNLKEQKEEEVKSYFDELITQEKIDFIQFEQLGIKVGLSDSLKSLKDKTKAFIDKVVEELKLIDTQEHKVEILVEYKQSLNVALAITTVNDRVKAIEEAKKQEEIRNQQLQAEKEHIAEIEQVVEENKQEEIQIIEVVEKETEIKEELYNMTFTVKNETISRLTALKEFLKAGGYDYE